MLTQTVLFGKVANELKVRAYSVVSTQKGSPL